jgi:hypothetical protein
MCTFQFTCASNRDGRATRKPESVVERLASADGCDWYQQMSLLVQSSRSYDSTTGAATDSLGE